MFHDYCHLSDLGIERAMAAVTDAVLGRPVGTTAPGPGLPMPARAFGFAHAAAHLAYQGQPPEVVRDHLRRAVAADPDLAPVLTAVRDVLSAPRPVWTHPAVADLPAAVRPFILALLASRTLSPELWTLRECLSDVMGPEVTGDATAEIDLLAAPDGRGHPLPNWTPERGHHHATASVSSLAFPLSDPASVTVEMTYRTPAAESAACVHLNGAFLGELTASRTWTTTTLSGAQPATRAGVNRLDIRWPVPAADLADRLASDGAALRRGEFPYVLPLFGEVFRARVRVGDYSTTSS
jgi:hypothetical protein